jgi:hypothetical protein
MQCQPETPVGIDRAVSVSGPDRNALLQVMGYDSRYSRSLGWAS